MASSFDKLPEDVLSKILQLLPAKELCRFRSVCRSWRSTLSDAAFIKAHAEGHDEPLFLAKFRDDEKHVYVVDLSGDVVKRIAGADGGHQVQRTRLKLACLAAQLDRCRLLNPATGGVGVVPVNVTMYRMNGVVSQHDRPTFFALGLVASTGEYKLPRCWHPFLRVLTIQQVQVLTINGGTAWRSSPGPPCSIDMDSGIVVDGVVYFFTRFYYGSNDPQDDILSFDLANEEWRRDLHGPLSTGTVTSEEVVLRSQLSLADLEGSLVLAHHRRHLSTVDLWFLLDFESEHWIKKYSIRTESLTSSLASVHQIIPLLVLHDGRLVIYIASVGLLFTCDPGTNTFTRVHMRGRLDSVGVYTGTLLSQQAEAMV